MKTVAVIALAAFVAVVGYVVYKGFSGEAGTMARELQVTDSTIGTGAEAVAGKKVTVHYTGTLESGAVFDSSKDRGAPFTFTLGAGEVIKGWDEGVAGMKVGGTRVLVIPPELGYGASGTPDGAIPPNAALRFEVELLGVE
jgi:FKBP-type peptidyl-prolyl cis-trans isomerase